MKVCTAEQAVLHYVTSALLMMLAVPLMAEAAGEDYRCVIKNVDAADAGRTYLDKQREHYIGREFTVNRRSGVMSGALKNSFASDPVVIDRGSNDNSYKVVTTLRPNEIGPGSAVHVLVVNEYEEQASKPFVFLSNDDIYRGTCVHFR